MSIDDHYNGCKKIMTMCTDGWYRMLYGLWCDTIAAGRSNGLYRFDKSSLMVNAHMTVATAMNMVEPEAYPPTKAESVDFEIVEFPILVDPAIDVSGSRNTSGPLETHLEGINPIAILASVIRISMLM
ncbi:hypothetical protein BU15DRAFT_67082 [Melanogaster broomeanus]|nr:hypothetical protein BU15DRAFT_67082 [Melanogaster broomeanus]